MCIFCAAIPVAATTGVALNAKQLREKKKVEATAEEISAPETPKTKPIMPMTAGVIVLLMIGSVTYHTLTYLP